MDWTGTELGNKVSLVRLVKLELKLGHVDKLLFSVLFVKTQAQLNTTLTACGFYTRMEDGGLAQEYIIHDIPFFFPQVDFSGTN